MPVGQTVAAIQSLFNHRSVAFSSLTRQMPIAIRVLYEFGGFPLAQFVIFAVILSIIRALRYSIGADKSCRLR